jgi:hypothetical protein
MPVFAAHLVKLSPRNAAGIEHALKSLIRSKSRRRSRMPHPVLQQPAKQPAGLRRYSIMPPLGKMLFPRFGYVVVFHRPPLCFEMTLSPW